jgi:hypothetical protein
LQQLVGKFWMQLQLYKRGCHIQLKIMASENHHHHHQKKNWSLEHKENVQT